MTWYLTNVVAWWGPVVAVAGWLLVQIDRDERRP